MTDKTDTEGQVPEALRLADECGYELAPGTREEIAAELLRLHAENEALRTQQPAPAGATFQQRVQPWLLECFGAAIAADRVERNHRFLEESLELVQALGCTASEAHQLVDYVFGRPVGDPPQEVGGVMVTLAALCLANGLDMHDAGEVELARISAPELVAKIRAKQAAKPKHSPLPQATTPQPAPATQQAGDPVAVVKRQLGGSTVAHLVGDVEVGDLLYRGAPTAQAAESVPAVDDANWAQLRSALAMLMLGWGRNPNQTMEACYRVLDSATEPGTCLALLRAAPDWRDFMAAARAPADSVTAPAGWKLVPVEPSVDQEWEGKEASRRVDSMAEARKIYKAMLAAAPTPPAQAADSVLEDAETALRKVLGVVQRYLPPDGPSAHDAMSEITAIVDPWPLGPLKKP